MSTVTILTEKPDWRNYAVDDNAWTIACYSTSEYWNCQAYITMPSRMPVDTEVQQKIIDLKVVSMVEVIDWTTLKVFFITPFNTEVRKAFEAIEDIVSDTMIAAAERAKLRRLKSEFRKEFKEVLI